MVQTTEKLRSKKELMASTSMTAYFFIYLNLVGQETAQLKMAL